MKLFRIGVLFLGLFSYQNIIQTNFFANYFMNELFMGEQINKPTSIKATKETMIIETDEQTTIYVFNQKKLLNNPIQNKLVIITDPPEIQLDQPKRTRIGKRMALLSGIMLYGEKMKI